MEFTKNPNPAKTAQDLMDTSENVGCRAGGCCGNDEQAAESMPEEGISTVGTAYLRIIPLMAPPIAAAATIAPGAIRCTGQVGSPEELVAQVREQIKSVLGRVADLDPSKPCPLPCCDDDRYSDGEQPEPDVDECDCDLAGEWEPALEEVTILLPALPKDMGVQVDHFTVSRGDSQVAVFRQDHKSGSCWMLGAPKHEAMKDAYGDRGGFPFWPTLSKREFETYTDAIRAAGQLLDALDAYYAAQTKASGLARMALHGLID